MIRRALVVTVVLAIILVAGAFNHHARGTRFASSVQPVAVSSEACREMLTTQGFGPSSVDFICADAEGSPWFSFTVRNAGLRGAWLNHCVVRGFDASGRLVYQTEIGFSRVGPPNGPAGPHLDPGETFRYSWYSKAQYPKGLAARFVADCQPIDYGLNIPA